MTQSFPDRHYRKQTKVNSALSRKRFFKMNLREYRNRHGVKKNLQTDLT